LHEARTFTSVSRRLISERCLAKIPQARVCKRAPLPPLLALGLDAGSIAGTFTVKAELIAFAKTGGPPQTGERT
jgi:hypothetical protein